VLGQHGSAALSQTMNSAPIDLNEIFAECDNLNELFERIVRHEQVALILQGAAQ
jgi:hypothetical protein